MNFGYLSQIFSHFAWKRVTAVEVLPTASNGHEFNSPGKLREILGTTPRKTKDGAGIPAKFFYLEDYVEGYVTAEGQLSWYDARANNPKRAPEWRLYYTDNSVIGAEGKAQVSDSLVIAFSPDLSSATVLIAKRSSTAESQLLWLFGLPRDGAEGFQTGTVATDRDVDFARVAILESVGISIPTHDETLLAKMQERFGGGFPKSNVFSAFVRKELSEARAEDDPDAAIVDWMQNEEFAFRVLEKALVGELLRKGISDVDSFFAMSLSFQNRRKSRAGLAFENHLGAVFDANRLVFDRTPVLENKSKPDFLFPGKKQYVDASFSHELLTLLGAKTTCKDRWRQVLAEGLRLKERHLITLEPAISETQLCEMRAHALNLVVPSNLHPTFCEAQRPHILSVASFIAKVRERQTRAGVAK
jgi:hypothetical protein